MKLDKSQQKHLKALAHSMKPVVRVGQNGVTDAVVAEIDRALDDHELIKIKVPGSRDERSSLVSAICDATQASQVALTGGVAIVFRRNARKPKIEL